MHVALVVPDRLLWSGQARTVIAKTTEGDIGVLTGHAPVFGVLAEGSLVEILNDDAEPVRAAVSGGFLSVANDRVSILAAHAQLADEVDADQAQQPPGNGDLFGIAIAPDGKSFYYVEDDMNALVEATK